MTECVKIRVKMEFHCIDHVGEKFVMQSCKLKDMGFSGIGKHLSADLTSEQFVRLQNLLLDPVWNNWKMTVL